MKQIFFLFFLCCHVAGAMDQPLSSPAGDDTGTKTLTMSVLVREPALKSTNVTTPGTVVPGIDPRVLAMLEVSIEQRIMANLSSSLQVAFAQTREEAERMRREVESSNRESQLLRETIGFQATRVQELENRLRKEEVERTFLQCKIDAKPVPQRIEEMSADIIRKATIQEKNSSVAAICERLVPFSFLLPVEKLRIIEQYVRDTKIEEIAALPIPLRPILIRDVFNRGWGDRCWNSVYLSDMQFLQNKYGMLDVAYDRWGGGIAEIHSRHAYGGEGDNIRMFNHFKDKENAFRARTYEEEKARIEAANFECAQVYAEKVSLAEVVPFPSTELDDLITQFNGLLALHVE